MIAVNLATYPPRRENLRKVVASLSRQVDLINVVLNEYTAPLPELADFSNVRQIIPTVDTKDTGKFYPDLDGVEIVLLADDDIVYPKDYVALSVKRFRAIQPRAIAGYHGSTYFKPRFSLAPRRFQIWACHPKKIGRCRSVLDFTKALEQFIIVDELGTGTTIMRAADMPPFGYVADAQKMVDVRLARWCFEHGISPVALPRPENWLAMVHFRNSIYKSFTRKDLPKRAEEILTYAFRVVGRGTTPNLSWGEK